MRTLFLFALGLAAACALGVYLLGQGQLPLAAAVALLAGLVFLLLCKEQLRRPAVVLLGAALGFVWLWCYSGVMFREAETLHEQRLPLAVIAQDYPRPWGTERLSVTVTMTSPGGQERTAQLRYPKTVEDVAPGSELSGIMLVRDSRWAYSEESYYEPSIGLSFVLYAQGSPEVIQGERSLSHLPNELVHQVGERMDVLFGEESFFFRGLLLGDKTGLTPGWKGYFNRSGLAHVIVVSGMHISFLVSMVALLAKKNLRVKTALALAILLVYMPLVGLSPSVLRAGVLWVLLLIAPLFGRERDSLTSVGAALLLTLLQNPFAIASWSLQLSYGSALGILLFAGGMQSRFRAGYEKVKRPKVKRILNGATSSIAVSLSALVFTTPLLALYVGQVNLLSVLANLLVILPSSAAFVMGLAALLLSLIFMPLALLLGGLASIVGAWVLLVVKTVGGMPFAAIAMHVDLYRMWFTFAYSLALLFIFARKKLAIRPIIPAAAAAILLLCCMFLESIAFTAQGVRIAVLDVGQGQSVFVQAGDFTLLMDCGGSSSFEAAERAADYLRSAGESRLDLLVLSHYDKDHAGGIPMLLEWVDVDLLAMPDNSADNRLRQDIEAAALATGTEILYVTADFRLSNDLCEVTLYAPFSGASSNESGVCMLFSQGDFDVLITGDVNMEMERRLVKYGSLPDIEVLVAGHHGSHYSTGDVLLEAVLPELVLISVGADNSYGHPHEDALARIDAAGAVIWRTDVQGDLIVTSEEVFMYGR
jgi:DNA internalization-related competence protein ComEC/Rec2